MYTGFVMTQGSGWWDRGMLASLAIGAFRILTWAGLGHLEATLLV